MQRRVPSIAVLALALVAGCQAEPGFDEKFEQRSGELTAKARQIESDAKVQLDAAREAEQAAAEASGAALIPSAPAASPSVPDPATSTQ
jgi:outer membrane murein-binding lipoprotein Lpp